MSTSPKPLSSQRGYYGSYWSSEGFAPDQRVMPSLAELLEHHVKASDACLDFGCGPGGGPAAWLSQRVASYVGMDISATAVEAARRAGLDARCVDDPAHLPVADNAFDLVVCIEVLEHLLEPHIAVKEFRRVLRPGGRVVATVPNVAYWRRRADLALLGRWNPLGDGESAFRPWRDPHVRFFGRANLRDMFREAGFAAVDTGGHGGTWSADIPGIRNLSHRSTAGPVFARLVQRCPSMFAHHLHAIAIKPAHIQ